MPKTHLQSEILDCSRASGAHAAIVGGHVPASEGDFALQNCLLFAKTHPDEVAGVVLVDSNTAGKKEPR